ncbi:hypothetical protein [Pseudomonas sp. LAM2023]|uniref:hypothetical protein n=1 Tax=Pseudomonas sp. LAM2023 TaxID=2800477 RepID=UPI001F3F8A01|nr:hypothetical protein [Pseudomonas sp. LAM2023]
MERSIASRSCLFIQYMSLSSKGEHLYSILLTSSAMTHHEDIADDSFAFFSREELLEQQCLLLESELAVMGEELSASREKIATLVLMWTGVRNEVRQAEAELSQAKNQLQTSAGAC